MTEFGHHFSYVIDWCFNPCSVFVQKRRIHTISMEHYPYRRDGGYTTLSNPQILSVHSSNWDTSSTHLSISTSSVATQPITSRESRILIIVVIGGSSFLFVVIHFIVKHIARYTLHSRQALEEMMYYSPQEFQRSTNRYLSKKTISLVPKTYRWAVCEVSSLPCQTMIKRMRLLPQWITATTLREPHVQWA